jgi:hypothetical protein
MNTGKNKYYKQSHISERKFRELLRCFALDLNAKESSQLTGISHVSGKSYAFVSKSWFCEGLATPADEK